MRVNYSSTYVSIIGLPTKMKALLKANYRIAQMGFARSGLTREEWAALMDFVQSYPKDLLKKMGEEKEDK